MDMSWIELVEELSPAALTVRAQALSPNDNGKLLWDVFFPRANVDSVDLKDIQTIDDRAVADRREWNARGRLIPVLTPEQREMSIVPIEGYGRIDEREMQKLMEGAFGNASIVEQQLMVRLPDRAMSLA